ncbi:MAG: hypothetical protein JJE53_01685 [Candidatus Pacebacteria bacterium]|nr:hypothetical protein [Candidatus Paceibacterota bacterium]
MRKNLKYSVSSIIIMLSLVLGFMAYAEDDVTTTTNEVTNVEAQREVKIEAYKLKMSQELAQIKLRREEFQKELNIKREENKLRIEEIKSNFKENIKTIKDENKKIASEKIVATINEINARRTEQLAEKLNQIKNVLISINSRITKAENKILDVAALSTKQSAAQAAIDKANDAIAAQMGVSYSVTESLTDEAVLRTEMKNLRDKFQKDIKALNEVVKAAHAATVELATSIAKIPNVDEEEVEENDAANN